MIPLGALFAMLRGLVGSSVSLPFSIQHGFGGHIRSGRGADVGIPVERRDTVSSGRTLWDYKPRQEGGSEAKALGERVVVGECVLMFGVHSA